MYEEIKTALLKLCEQEGLRLIEAELHNKKICYTRFEGRVVLNSAYHKFKNDVQPASV